MKKFLHGKILILVFTLLTLILLDLSSGKVELELSTLIKNIFKDYNSPDLRILFDYRIPRTLSAILCGIAVSVAGLLMQTIFRNPLAGPYILGISSGASLGAALVVMSGTLSVTYFSKISIVGASWLGSFVFLAIIMTIALRIRHILTILIIGVILGNITSAIINLLQYLSSSQQLKDFVVWTMGSFNSITNNDLPIFSITIIAGLIISVFSSKGLNTLMVGEDYAKTMGLNIIRNRLLVFLSSSLLIGTSTAFCGPIAFIGIIIPHIARWTSNSSDHKTLITHSALLGASFMLVCDIISNRPEFNEIIPINTISSILGIPILLYLILKKQKIFIG